MSPGIWYQMHHNVEGKINVTGLVLPGQPFVIVGHNDSIAWGMTNVAVDDLDFYAEKLNDDSTQYLLDGEWKDLQIKTETIKTKEGVDFLKTLRFTHRGPIVNDFKKDADMPVSIHWLGNEMSNEIRTVYKLNRAKNWTDFRDAVKTFTSISQNIVYADVKGNIGLQCSAGVPIEKETEYKFTRETAANTIGPAWFHLKNYPLNLIRNEDMYLQQIIKLCPTIIHITLVIGLPCQTESTEFGKCWKVNPNMGLKILKKCSAM